MEILNKADIGVFGGSGFYSFLKDIEEVKVETPYGETSDSVFLGKIGNHTVAFMPRHGRNHSIPQLIHTFSSTNAFIVISSLVFILFKYIINE